MATNKKPRLARAHARISNQNSNSIPPESPKITPSAPTPAPALVPPPASAPKPPNHTGRAGLLEDPATETKITDDITNALRAGNYFETACSFAGIGKFAGYEWLKRGGREEREGLETPYTRFANAVKKAQADAVVSAVGLITRIGQGYTERVRKIGEDGKPVVGPDGEPVMREVRRAPVWQAIAWRLERTDPSRFGLRSRLDLAGVKDRPISVTLKIGEMKQGESADGINDAAEADDDSGVI